MKKKLVNRILSLTAKILVFGMVLGVIMVFGLQQLDWGVLFYSCMIGSLLVYFIHRKVNKKKGKFLRL